MHIIVCLKQVPTPGSAPGCSDGRLRHDPRAGLVLNPFDSYALEAALRIKEQHGGTVEALTLGEQEVVPVLREALAMGADRAIHVAADIGALNSMQVAYLLAASIRRLDRPDLIFTGKESTVLATGAVGPMLAEFLAVPHIAGARSLAVEDRAIKVERSRESVKETLACEFPALVTVSREIGEPRCPTVRAVLAARKMPIASLDLPELDIPADFLLEQLRFLQDSDYSPAPVRSSGEILSGSIEEQIDILCRKLIADGILEERRNGCVCQ